MKTNKAIEESSIHIHRPLPVREKVENKAKELAQLAYGYIEEQKKEEAVGLLCELIVLPDAHVELKEWSRGAIKRLICNLTTVEAPPLESEKRLDVLKEYELLTVRGDSSPNQIEQLELMVAKDPDNTMLLDWFAFSKYRAEDFKSCIVLYERLLSLQAPRDSDLYYLGSANMALFQVDSAVSWWRRLADEFPNSKLLNRVIRKLRTIRRSSNTASAGKLSGEEIEMTAYEQSDGSGLVEVEKALAANPDDVSVIDWAAFANYTLGNYSRASALYTRLIRLEKCNIQAHYYYANCLYKLSEVSKAQLHWRKVIELSPDHRLAQKSRKRLTS